METISVRTNFRNTFVDITHDIADVLGRNGWSDGILVVYTPHTTSAITINENADSDVQTDMNAFFIKTNSKSVRVSPYGGGEL